MAKFIPNEVLKTTYGLAKGNSVGVMKSCYATNASKVIVTKIDDYKARETLYNVTVITPDDEASVFIIKESELEEKEIITKTTDETDIFASINLSVNAGVMDAVTFLDSSVQKKFSKWLFDLDNDAYNGIVERKDYESKLSFEAVLTLEEFDHYIGLENQCFDDSETYVNIEGIVLPRDNDVLMYTDATPIVDFINTLEDECGTDINIVAVVKESGERKLLYIDELREKTTSTESHDIKVQSIIISKAPKFVKASEELVSRFVDLFYWLMENDDTNLVNALIKLKFNFE